MTEKLGENLSGAPASREREIGTLSGWLALPLIILGIVGAVILFLMGVTRPSVPLILIAVFSFVAMVVCLKGLFALQPNQAAVITLVGAYKGSVRSSGFHFTNPFYSKSRISLRSHNLNGERLKVNDQRGNPTEIAAVVVWRVSDSAQATFDVEDFVNFVEVQSESAVRDLAGAYSYDHGENGEDEGELTLRGGSLEVAAKLKAELQERVAKAGVLVEEARVSHLAYAPEIASAMLKRQQAEAIISARRKIVDGAVGMVEHALAELASREVLELDDERKAAMVSNLLVILCGDQEATPVVNTGTLYT